MYEPATASDSLDYAFCCEVLPHNDPDNLKRTLREPYRVLRPGGRLFVINEPLRFLLKPKLDHAEEVAEFEGNEHVYFIHPYLLAARQGRVRADRALPAVHPDGQPRRGSRQTTGSRGSKAPSGCAPPAAA